MAGAEEVSTEVARFDGGDFDAQALDFLAQGLREDGDGRFACAVEARCRHSEPASNGTKVGDDTGASSAHVREDGSDDVHLPEDVGLELIEGFLSTM